MADFLFHFFTIFFMNSHATFHSISSELQEIQDACTRVVAQSTSQAILITVVYRDTVGRTLSVLVPSDDITLSQIPQGGTYFIWIN